MAVLMGVPAQADDVDDDALVEVLVLPVEEDGVGNYIEAAVLLQHHYCPDDDRRADLRLLSQRLCCWYYFRFLFLHAEEIV